MKQTLIEKIISHKVGKTVHSGDIEFVPVDLVMGTDGTTPLALKIFEDYHIKRVAIPEKIIFVNDHFSPPTNISTANLSLQMEQFANKYGIRNYKVGRGGICHVLLPELNIIKPYDIIVGADSHTCTYGGLSAFSTGIGSTDMACAMATGKIWMRIPETIKIIITGNFKYNVGPKDLVLHIVKLLGVDGATYKIVEFHGDALKHLDMSGRMTICNMIVECGAKAGIINVDSVAEEYFQDCGIVDIQVMYPDGGAHYNKTYEINISSLEPQIACPYTPANVVDAKKLIGTKINQVVLGSCTNGRIEDFRVAHKYIKNRTVHEEVKLIIIPGSQKVLYQMEEEGLLIDFIKSNAVIAPPSCGPCMGGHMGVLGEGEVGLYTTNRNFYGRNGAPSSKVYLSNPMIAAYSAVEGSIQVPDF